jgi:plasmid stabilization system protein ParE
MTYRLIIRDEAEADLTAAARWYENEVANLGVEFLTEAGRVIHNAVANPFLYPAISRRPQVHRALTRRFPYRVFYRIRHGTVIVFAVLHAKRADATWKERL